MEIDVKAIRKKLGLTQMELGNMMGVSKNTVSNYETGGVIPESKRSMLINLMNHDPKVEKTLNVIKTAGDNNITNTGTIDGGVNVGGNQEINRLKARIKDLENEVKELKNDKAILQEFVTFLQNKK